MSETFIEVVRVVTLGLGAIAFGLLAAIMFVIVLAAKRAGRFAPFHPEILIGVMNMGLIASAIAWIGERAVRHEPFTFFGTPWLFLFFAIGDAGLFLFIYREYTSLTVRATPRSETMALKKGFDAAHTDLLARLEALEKKKK